MHLLARCTQVRLENRTENAHTDTQPPARESRQVLGFTPHNCAAATLLPGAAARRRTITHRIRPTRQQQRRLSPLPASIPLSDAHSDIPVCRCGGGRPHAAREPLFLYQQTGKRERERERESNLVNRRTDGRTDGRTRCNSRSADTVFAAGACRCIQAKLLVEGRYQQHADRQAGRQADVWLVRNATITPAAGTA